jgi:hypothetical protein
VAINPGNGWRTNPDVLRRDIDEAFRRISSIEKDVKNMPDLIREIALMNLSLSGLHEDFEAYQRSQQKYQDAQSENTKWWKRAFVGSIFVIVTGVITTALISLGGSIGG